MFGVITKIWKQKHTDSTRQYVSEKSQNQTDSRTRMHTKWGYLPKHSDTKKQRSTHAQDLASRSVKTISHCSIKKYESIIGRQPKAFYIGNVAGLRKFLGIEETAVCTLCCQPEIMSLVTYIFNGEGVPVPLCDHCRGRD